MKDESSDLYSPHMSFRVTEKARQYKRTTIRRLDTLSGNQCAAPECDKPLIAKDGESIVSKICHIEAASPKGARYNSNMTDEERRHYDNLLLLCDECHVIVDNKANVPKYTVALLCAWKKNHESIQLAKLAADTSLLAMAINAITKANFDSEQKTTSSSPQSFEIQENIDYNAVKRNKSVLEEYKVFNAKIDGLYEELENQGSFRKDKLLRAVKHSYLKAKGKYVGASKNPIEIIRANADNIIEDVENDLLEIAEKDTDHFREDISFGISLIMVDAFMRCKILEEPQTS